MKTSFVRKIRPWGMEALERRDLLTAVSMAAAGESVAADPEPEVSIQAAEMEVSIWRPARRTPSPVIQGPQTSEVVGPAGEEIQPDEHGRVKVQFYWDRENPVDDTSSCWIRTAQPHTTGAAGSSALPSVGWEVMIGFADGDPDRPLALGRLHHRAASTYQLPGGKVASSLQTSTSPGGGGTNEVRMQDTAGSQLLSIHAQHDLESTIQHRDGPSSSGVNGAEKTTVHNNRTETIGGAHTETIGANQSLTVGAAQEVTVGGVQTNSGGSGDEQARLVDAVWEELSLSRRGTVLKGKNILEN